MGINTLFGADLFWQESLQKAFELAKNEHKNVMVMVEGEECRWCKKMEHRTLADESVQKRLAAYIVVKVSREDENVFEQLPMVEGVPTIFFMTSEKKVLEKVVGYFNVEDFISYIDDVERNGTVKP